MARTRAAARSPEFAFVLACAGSGGAAAPPRAGLDDARLAAVAHRHQVVPLVVAGLRAAGAPVPAALRAHHRPIAALRSAREAVRLHGLLVAGGVDALFLKGSTLAVLAYGALDRRQFCDIDILVAASEAVRAVGVLEQAGYRAENDLPGGLAASVGRLLRVGKDIVLRHHTGGHVVELHWRLTDNLREPAIGAGDVQWVELTPRTPVPTLGPEALFGYLCVHGAGHCWARLRWLADVAGLIARAPDGGDRLWRSAVARGQGLAAASAILLAGELFGMPAPPGFARPRSPRLALLLAASRRVIGAGGGTTELAHTSWRGWAETGAKLLVAVNAGDLAGWTRRLLISSVDVAADEGRLSPGRHLLRRVPRLIERRRARRRTRAVEHA